MVWLGQYDEGLATMLAEPMLRDERMQPIVRVQQLWVAWRRGDHATARRYGAELARGPLAEFAPWTAAFVAAVLGDREAMFTHLERAFAIHDPWYPFIATNRDFAPYRSDPRFVAHLARLHL
jgi:hypothetical protein